MSALDAPGISPMKMLPQVVKAPDGSKMYTFAAGGLIYELETMANGQDILYIITYSPKLKKITNDKPVLELGTVSGMRGKAGEILNGQGFVRLIGNDTSLVCFQLGCTLPGKH